MFWDDLVSSLAGEYVPTDYVYSDVTVTAVPEPAAGSLLALGLAAMTVVPRRRSGLAA